MQQYNEIEKRKIIVFNVLRLFLDNIELDQALSIWDNEFDQNDSVSYNSFLNKICTTPHLNEKKIEILVSITKGLKNGIDFNHSQNNGNGNGNGIATSNHSNSYENSQIRIFEHILNRLVSDLSNSDSEILNKITDRVSDSVKKLNMTNTQKTQILNFISRKTPRFYTDIKMKDQREVLHSVYVYGCELVGPIKADKIMSQTIKSAESLPEAKVISPKNWL